MTWNTRDMTLEAIQSVHDDLNRSPYAGAVWVVDNGSTDGTVQAIRQQFPHVHLIEAHENVGFAKGNNLAINAMQPDLPDYIFLLNPDCVVHEGAVVELVSALQNSESGVAGARLTYGDGSFQHSAFGFPDLWHLLIELLPVPGRLYESELNGRYPRDYYAGDQPFEVGHPLGATFMVKREAVEAVGLLDEGFALYCEEVDWAWRMRDAGWGALCVPTAHVTHYGGQSTSQVKPEATRKLWLARLRLYEKHYSTLTVMFARFLIRAGMRRALLRTARDSSLDDSTRKAMIDTYQVIIKASRKSQL